MSKRRRLLLGAGLVPRPSFAGRGLVCRASCAGRAQLAHVPKVNDAPATRPPRSWMLLRRDEIRSLQSISGDAPSLGSCRPSVGENNSGQHPVGMVSASSSHGHFLTERYRVQKHDQSPTSRRLAGYIQHKFSIMDRGFALARITSCHAADASRRMLANNKK